MLLRIEILIFLVSAAYGLYYIFDIFYKWHKERKNKNNERIEKRKKILEKNKKTKSDAVTSVPSSAWLNGHVSANDMERLRDTIKRVQVNKARGYYDTARSLIVEWLAIDKYNRELNSELWDVYELEEKYKNAEYIYKDMLKVYQDNVNLLKKLGNVFALQWNLQSAVKTYEKAYEKKRDDIEIVDILSTLYFELKNFKKCLKYTKLFLKDKPRDVEKLWMKWYCFEKESKIENSIECYEKILEFQPYNMEVKERIAKLEKKL